MALNNPLPDGVYSLRFYQTGTATANFADRSWLFTHPADSTKQAWSKGFKISAATQDLSVSFDGTNVHCVVPAGTSVDFIDRYEGGIAVKGNGSVYTIEAW